MSRPDECDEYGERDERDEHDVRIAMGQLYGAAAAMVAGDRDGARLLLGDLRDGFQSVTELLVTVSFATLERLESAFHDRSLRPAGAQRPDARDLLRTAEGFRIAPSKAVHAAAWRLDAVRCNDRRRAAEDVARSAEVGGEAQLVAGAVALLAATVARGAESSGDQPVDAARRLCLAVSLGRAD